MLKVLTELFQNNTTYLLRAQPLPAEPRKSYLIKKNKKGSYIHFKIKGKGNVIDELEKNEAIDKNLLRYMTVKVKKFNLEAKYFSKKDEYEKKEYKKEYNRD